MRHGRVARGGLEEQLELETGGSDEIAELSRAFAAGGELAPVPSVRSKL